jgi:hypothetical protein
MNAHDIDFDRLIRRLHLPTVTRLYSDLASPAVKRGHDPSGLPSPRRGRRPRLSRRESSAPSAEPASLATIGRSVILAGPSCLGKTLLAIALPRDPRTLPWHSCRRPKSRPGS